MTTSDVDQRTGDQGAGDQGAEQGPGSDRGAEAAHEPADATAQPASSTQVSAAAEGPREPVSVINPLAPLVPVGKFFAMAIETFRALFRRPFAFGEFIDQTAFVAGVSVLPAIALMVPFLGVVIFLINQLLIQIGAIDVAGAGVGLGVTREVAPLASVLIVAGAGATAICADLGARTIREEIDAMSVLGIDPIQRLVLPRVLASTFVALMLNAVVTIVGLATGYGLSVLLQGASPGQFVANLTLLVHVPDFIVSEIKAGVFGLAAGLVACYRGLTVGGGPKGVGDAVNQTVVLAVALLFVLNTVITAIYLQLGYG